MIFGPNSSISDDGWPVLALAGIVTILISIISLPIGFFLLAMMVWLAHLLRVPDRQTKVDYQIIYAPCDGVILEISSDKFPDDFVNEAQPAQRITIQTRLSDLQLQTSPITGYVIDNFHTPGLFTKWGDHPASWQAARLANERREIRFRDPFNRDVVLVQLGSETARQLICRLAGGKFVQAGSPIGMARIAGVVDVYISARCKIISSVGQHMIAGETTLAEFATKPSALQTSSPNQE